MRQCDGDRVQCLVMVRDDFWVSLSRFMGDLRIEILEGQNAALVDLFDLINARKVLIEFGRGLRLADVPESRRAALLERLAGWSRRTPTATRRAPRAGCCGNGAGWIFVRQVDRTATRVA